MYYIVLGTDAPGTSEIRLRTRAEHRAYLRNPGTHAVKVHLGGPTLSGDGEAMNGTLLVVEAKHFAEVERFVADDPYSQADVFSSVLVRPWSWSLGTPEADQ